MWLTGTVCFVKILFNFCFYLCHCSSLSGFLKVLPVGVEILCWSEGSMLNCECLFQVFALTKLCVYMHTCVCVWVRMRERERERERERVTFFVCVFDSLLKFT